jgi:organic radical activating enzyme
VLLSRLPDGRPEIFTSIQGEGITCGLASIFVRLSLCNLACSFCDTKYTWDWDRYDRDIETIELAAEDVARDVLARARRGPKNVVITGGEPLLQQRDLVDVAQRLHDAGLGIEVETNGTITPADALAACVDQWNVSPKLASSGNAAAARERAETIAWFAARTSAYFKFVIVDPPDVDEAAAFAERYEIAPARIILMPEGVAPRVLAERSRWLSERCQQTGARLGMRLHVLLWGAERGR